MERALVIAVIVMLVVVGSVFIGLVYGWASVFTGLLCLLPGAGVFLMLWLFMSGLEYLMKDREE